MAQTPAAACTAIKENRLDTFPQFHPATADLFSGWLLDPGDIVTVKSGETEYKVPVYRMDMDWKGDSRVQIQSSGKQTRPQMSPLRRNAYGGGRSQAESFSMVRYRSDIEKTNERLYLWATEEEWSAIAQDYVQTGKSEFEIVHSAINERVTQNQLNTTLTSYLTIEANQTILASVMAQDGKVTAASIATAINTQTGTSQVHISADKIDITGDMTLSGIMTIDGGSLLVKGPIIARVGTTPQLITGNFSVASANGYVRFPGTAVGEYYDMTTSIMSSMIVKAQQDGNNLKLWKYGDPANTPSINFSKATTLSGAWSSGTYTVTASPQGTTHTNTPTLQLDGNGTADNFSAQLLDYTDDDRTQHPSPTSQKSIYGYMHRDGYSVGVYKSREASQSEPGTYEYSGKVAQVNVSDVYNAGGQTAWLFYADDQTGHGSNPQGTLDPDSYMCVGYIDANGDVQKLQNTTWKTPSGGGGGTGYNDGWAAAREKVEWPNEIGDNVLKNTMTVGVPSDTVDEGSSMVFRIDLGDGLTWKSSASGQTPSGTQLSSLSSMINSHLWDRGYIEFYAEICNNGNSNKNYSRRKYYITIGSAS